MILGQETGTGILATDTAVMIVLRRSSSYNLQPVAEPIVRTHIAFNWTSGA